MRRISSIEDVYLMNKYLAGWHLFPKYFECSIRLFVIFLFVILCFIVFYIGVEDVYFLCVAVFSTLLLLFVFAYGRRKVVNAKYLKYTENNSLQLFVLQKDIFKQAIKQHYNHTEDFYQQESLEYFIKEIEQNQQKNPFSYLTIFSIIGVPLFLSLFDIFATSYLAGIKEIQGDQINALWNIIGIGVSIALYIIGAYFMITGFLYSIKNRYSLLLRILKSIYYEKHIIKKTKKKNKIKKR